MAPKRQVGVPGRIVGAQGREIIANVLRFMKREAANRAPVIDVANYKQRVLEATGISDRVYRQIIKDMELIDAGMRENYTAPTRTRKCKIEEVMIKQSEFAEQQEEPEIDEERGE